ncbi:MAG: hypothetical protein OEW89_04270 [Gammaproteobacteria bacterium]|nr:hypothetical protein [Gammaproteobacteria bacterium]MDH5594297.1 hypothetical protein [Gammaproteobacteria bacterium]MDH5613910.1 hypothetical protein [Gammaproteobacteria bacterium]
MIRRIYQGALVALLFMAGSLAAQAEKEYKPFILAYKTSGSVDAVVSDVKQKLTSGGFEIAGSYSPYPSATIIGVTNDTLKKAASKSEMGGFGVAQRVSVTKVGSEIQVSYTNPTYMAHVYRMDGDLGSVTSQMKSALGANMEYGPEEGLTADDARGYHYKFMMPYFDDALEIAEYGSYDEAVSKVEAGLKSGKNGATKVYRVDVSGKKESLFGVALGNDANGKNDGSDSFVMKEIDFKPVRSTAHLPYDILVSGNKVYALPAEFRIAINFPDLSMMGANSFMNIMGCPTVIANMLAKTSGNENY